MSATGIRDSSATEHPDEITVLIVEDESLVALDLKRQLEDDGFDVLDIVSHGEAAIAATQRLKPDVVLMDVRLQGPLDGVTVGEELYVCENTPVVFLTAYSDEGTLARAAGTSAYAYLVKPIAPGSLCSTLRMARRKHDELMSQRALDWRQ
jgi:AmiR/NasT family two-component response regulator